MDPRRFDSLIKRLGMRRSRRDAMRAGAAAVVGMATFGSVRTALMRDTVTPDVDTTATDRAIALSFYPYDGDVDQALTVLKPLIRVMQQQPGFITLSFIEGDEAIYLVTTFLDKTTSDAGTKALDAWIAENASEILGSEPERDSGDVFLRSESNAGCWCRIDDETACGTDDLFCCASADAARGICLTVATICPGTEDDEETTDEEEIDPTPTPVPVVTPAGCTSEGCSCVAGLDGSCDSDLFCCGADELAGTGVCKTVCPCGSEGCDCVASVINTCDDGLICCAPGEIGGRGTCQYACTCTDLGCACTTGVEGTCDDGLVCCGIGSQAPGSIGACLTECATDAHCPGGDGCECGAVWKCNDGLLCCGGDSGICSSEC